jgi:thioester reductase-like protein
MAKDLDVPIYYISTAFLWSKSANQEKTRNAYEKDKSYSEKLLQDSNIRHTIFRPSVLVGNSVTGKLINWTGYYLLVSKFWQVAKTAGRNRIKFPILVGTSNMMPVNQVAEDIVQTVMSFKLNELIYVTNPEPPDAQWVLETTLDFLGIRDKFEFQAMSFSDFEKIARTNEEEILYQTGKHFSPYWALPYNFPTSICRENLITKEYLDKTLREFQAVNKIGIV